MRIYISFDNSFNNVLASCIRNPSTIEHKTKQLGKFILATNQLDQTRMPTRAILDQYKNQFQPEKSFRFLKSPLCMADAEAKNGKEGYSIAIEQVPDLIISDILVIASVNAYPLQALRFGLSACPNHAPLPLTLVPLTNFK